MKLPFRKAPVFAIPGGERRARKPYVRCSPLGNKCSLTGHALSSRSIGGRLRLIAD